MSPVLSPTPLINPARVDTYGEGFSLAHYLRLHKLKVLLRETFTCVECGNSLTKKSGLVKHVRTIHLGHKYYRCNDCGKDHLPASTCQDVECQT